jgi:hypothetical protein
MNNKNNNKIEFLPLKSENAQHPSLELNLEWSGGHYEPLR